MLTPRLPRSASGLEEHACVLPDSAECERAEEHACASFFPRSHRPAARKGRPADCRLGWPRRVTPDGNRPRAARGERICRANPPGPAKVKKATQNGSFFTNRVVK